jgi:hypothetical protein
MVDEIRTKFRADSLRVFQIYQQCTGFEPVRNAGRPQAVTKASENLGEQ